MYGERIIEDANYFSGYNREYDEACKIVKGMGTRMQYEFAYSIACLIESKWKEEDRIDKVREIFPVSDDFEINVIDFINHSEMSLKNIKYGKIKLSRENTFAMVRNSLIIKILADIEKANEKKSVLQYRKFNNKIVTGIPPCVKKYIAELDSGKNINHNARFLLATFHLNKGFNLDYIKSLYMNSENFVESITLMQLKQIKTNNYRTPGCQKLKDQSICPINCGASSPMQYKE